VSAPTEPVRTADLTGGRVRRLGQWVVGLRRDPGSAGPAPAEPFAVSRRCRHQLADLSRGHVDADGCLVCPWHQSRYDVTTGRMVEGPKGFLGYHGPARGYRQLVHAYSQVLRLRVGRARLDRDEVRVD
jgi:nitrite reductase/ring-hydroxylating ferredoxin subunit